MSPDCVLDHGFEVFEPAFDALDGQTCGVTHPTDIVEQRIVSLGEACFGNEADYTVSSSVTIRANVLCRHLLVVHIPAESSQGMRDNGQLGVQSV